MGAGEEPAPLLSQLFDLQMIICEKCNLNPFEIKRSPFVDFCELADRLLDKIKRENKKYFNGKLKKRAGDNWF